MVFSILSTVRMFALSASVLCGFLWYFILCWYKPSVPKVQKTVDNYIKVSACLTHPLPAQSLDLTYPNITRKEHRGIKIHNGRLEHLFAL